MCVCGDNAITRVREHARAGAGSVITRCQTMAYHKAVAIINNVGGPRRRRSERARTPVTKRAADGFGAVADYYRPVGREPRPADGRRERDTRDGHAAPSTHRRRRTTDGTGRIDK